MCWCVLVLFAIRYEAVSAKGGNDPLWLVDISVGANQQLQRIGVSLLTCNPDWSFLGLQSTAQDEIPTQVRGIMNDNWLSQFSNMKGTEKREQRRVL